MPTRESLLHALCRKAASKVATALYRGSVSQVAQNRRCAPWVVGRPRPEPGQSSDVSHDSTSGFSCSEPRVLEQLRRLVTSSRLWDRVRRSARHSHEARTITDRRCYGHTRRLGSDGDRSPLRQTVHLYCGVSAVWGTLRRTSSGQVLVSRLEPSRTVRAKSSR